MTRLGRLTAVLGGYAVALGVAIAVVVLRTLTVGAEARASSGMVAFGETILFGGVFGLLAVVPTALALYFLRGYQPLWVTASRSSIALGILAIAAGVVVLWVAPAAADAHFAALILLFMAPLLAVAFALAALIAPAARFRAQLAFAAAMETAVALPFLYWLWSHRFGS